MPFVTINSNQWKVLENIETLIEHIFNTTLLHFEDFHQKNFFLDVTLTDDEEMQTINQTYRGKKKTTNVLSFPQFTSIKVLKDRDNVFLGDLVLSYSKILSESHDYNLDFTDHLSHLIIHGLLHMLGFDHEDATDAEVMEALEITILKKLGIKNPYMFDVTTNA